MAERPNEINISGSRNKAMIGRHNQIINNGAMVEEERQATPRTFEPTSAISVGGNQNSVMIGDRNTVYKNTRSKKEETNEHVQKYEPAAATNKSDRCEDSSHKTTEQGRIDIGGYSNSVMVGRKNTKYEGGCEPVIEDEEDNGRREKAYKLPPVSLTGTDNELMIGDVNTVCNINTPKGRRSEDQLTRERTPANFQQQREPTESDVRQESALSLENLGGGNPNRYGSMQSSVHSSLSTIDLSKRETTLNRSDADENERHWMSRDHSIVADGTRSLTRGPTSDLILSATVTLRNIVESVRDWKEVVDMEKIVKSIEEGLNDKYPTPPRIQQPNVILCLDSSSSMSGRAFEEMKTFAHTFIEVLDDLSSTEDKEQNVAVVSMSGSARVSQHLTNDYSIIRDLIDTLKPAGSSPFFEAIMVCLAASFATADITGTPPPLLIFVTDGKPTNEKDTGDSDETMLEAELKMVLIRLLKHLESIEDSRIPKPIVWVPVGEADKDFLKNMSSFGNGKMADKADAEKLASFFNNESKVSVAKNNKQDEENVNRKNFSQNKGTDLPRDSQVQDSSQRSTVKKSRLIWRYQDDNGRMQLYSLKYQKQISNDYERRPDLTSLVVRGPTSFRIFFDRMKEKSLEDNKWHTVELQEVNEEEFTSYFAEESE